HLERRSLIKCKEFSLGQAISANSLMASLVTFLAFQSTLKIELCHGHRLECRIFRTPVWGVKEEAQIVDCSKAWEKKKKRKALGRVLTH
ncbi:hypothetical protein AVEN_211275-1, partial [Araneus ventricosus]